EKTHGSAVLWRHVRDGCPVRERQRSSAFPVKFNKLPDYLSGPQHLRDSQSQVGRGDPFLQSSKQMDTDNFGRQEIDRLSEHTGFRLDAAHSPTHDPETVDHRGMRVRSNQAIWIADLFSGRTCANHPFRQIFQIYLMDNAD